MNNTLNETTPITKTQQTEQFVGILFISFILYIIYKIIYRSNKYNEMKKLNNIMDQIAFELFKTNYTNNETVNETVNEKGNKNEIKELQNEYNKQMIYLLKNMTDKLYNISEIVDELNKKAN
jgi:hypothetical protein